MIIFRTRHFSISDRKMINKVIEKLNKNGVEDFELVSRIPRDVISISVDEKGSVKIYLPLDFEYTQYDIDDFIRKSLGSHYRTSTVLDRNIYVQKVNVPLDLENICKLVEYIIEETEFCSLIE